MSVAIIQELPGGGRFHSTSEGMQLLFILSSYSCLCIVHIHHIMQQW